jgi:signal transduction histidine kinase
MAEPLRVLIVEDSEDDAELLIKEFQRGGYEIDAEREAVAEITKAGERAASLTRQLLAFSRKQLLMPEVLSVNRLIENLEKMLHRLIGEQIELVARLNPTLGSIRADVGQIEQVILNLIINARDAMPGGGRILIETAGVDLDDTYAREHVSVTPGRYVMIAVSDTGEGMDAETKNRIFEPFFTTKPSGTGLGLSTSRARAILTNRSGAPRMNCSRRSWRAFSQSGTLLRAPSRRSPGQQTPTSSDQRAWR